MLFDTQAHQTGHLPLDFVDLWMNEWSDDAKPNDSIKSNCGSLWFKSVTICPTQEMFHSMSHTYPLAIGNKKADHEQVGKLLKDDLLMLGSANGVPMCSRTHGGIDLVRAQLFACLQDQLERCGKNHLMGGGSDLHRRFWRSFPWHEFEEVLRPCALCRASLLDETHSWDCPECKDCINFTFDPQHPLLAHDAPKNFPFATDGDQLQPFQVAHAALVSAVTSAHKFLVNGTWSVEESAEWLQHHCIKTDAKKSILLHAERCKECQDIMADPESTAAEKEALEADKEGEQNLYKPWPIPPFWTRGVLLNQCPDVPMCLLFLGCAKTAVMLRVQAWMSNKRKDRLCQRDRVLHEEHRGLETNLDQDVTMQGRKGWVSKNNLAMLTIMKLFYSVLNLLASNKAPWVKPVDKPQDKWSAVDNKNWLQQRGLHAQGLAKQARERVQHHMTQISVSPIVEMTAGPVENVLLTMSSLNDLISLIMIEEIPNKECCADPERKIRMFLTHFADMEDQMPRGKKQMPQWLLACKFLLLLNLPDTVRRCGPIRDIWEGGVSILFLLLLRFLAIWTFFYVFQCVSF
jgi:hypothetical protein